MAETTLKLTSWNLEWLDKTMAALEQPGTSAARRLDLGRRLAAIRREIEEIDPDILCVIEGPKGPERARALAETHLGGAYVPMLRADDEYRQKGRQWIWFLVRPELAERSGAHLVPLEVWTEFTRQASGGEHGPTWPVYFWSEIDASRHSHYRHPQLLALELGGVRVELIGAHLKSKFSNVGRFHGTKTQRREFIEAALKARVKLATEAENIRYYLETRFRQEPNPAVFVLGDLNDGPGKELLERQFLFFDLVSTLQGDVFFARRFLNHALFDYRDDLRWTVHFRDALDADRDPHILLDHILFTQALVDGTLPVEVHARSGLVEHQVHDRVNALLTAKQKTSDHKPVSCRITVTDG